MNVRNLQYIRSKDPKLYEALTDILQGIQNTSQQTNSSGSGEPLAPPAVNGMKVSAHNGHFQVSIQDSGLIYRDIHYWVEHADNPHFTNPQIVHLGQTRNLNLFLGNVTRYFRAYSSYASSPPSEPVYHGSKPAPTAVEGGGAVDGPSFLASESSGTAMPGVGLSGPGPVPFRGGKPPVR